MSKAVHETRQSPPPSSSAKEKYVAVMHAISLVFSKDKLNRPQSENREILENWTIASQLGGNLMDKVNLILQLPGHSCSGPPVKQYLCIIFLKSHI